MSDVDNQQNVSVTNSSNVSIGNIKNIISSTSESKSHSEIKQIFIDLQNSVDSLPESIDKGIAQSAVAGLKEEAEKGSLAEEKKVSKWLNFLLETAPDAWEVAIQTFINPVKGLNTVFQKVAQYAKSNNNT